ncbi:invasin domain 3-containing protein [Providencia alcalifaciens]|uniref:invasin domain 3-containing protein n=1 Tax=Providencia alcalifaciens TaxID=126385 RepID=UPI0015EC12AC|nr:invasin domain 3-containing protein [Providencia alcalifaciens]QLQ97999.1 inverse autotransporter beta domain-containing protein [Providencia alcalifaciens]
MSSSVSTVKQKLANGFVIFTAIWSSVIMPVIPAYAKMLDNKELPSLGSDQIIDENNTEHLAAEYTKTVGTFLSQKKTMKDLSQIAQDYARNKVSSEATKEIEYWLSKAGNVKLNIDFDKKFSIKNSQFDWLIPWYDQEDILLFTQHTLHRYDERFHTNNGIGLRYFHEKSTIGMNAFIDHDLSHAHTRVGLGVEYWQDYLKLNANSYFGLTSWKSASELNHDFNAKPAHGWDIQVEGWLPNYPHLGGNLRYEQYYGDSVALFGKTKRQKNPNAATIGANWTPFPLFTLNASHKLGSEKQVETQAKLQFTWTFGKNLAHHLDPTKVAETRRLSGNRYDFVERNNNIILNYQKKTVLHLSLPSKIQGVTGQSVPLVKSFTSKYPLKHIEWQAPEFLAVGGSISSDDQMATLTLPSYQTSNAAKDVQRINRYRLRAIAYDIKGNASPVAETLIEITHSGSISISPRDMKFHGKGLANGNDINGLTAIARDSLGHAIPNTKVVFVLPNALTLASRKTKTTTNSSVQNSLRKKMQTMKVANPWEYITTTNDKGEALVQFTSEIAGSYEISAYTGNHQPAKAQVVFKPDSAQASIHSFTITRSGVLADGISTNSVKAHITDKNKNPLANQEVTFSATHAKIVDKATTNENGIVEVTLTSLKAGSSEVTISINGQSETKSVQFLSGKLHQVTILDVPEVYAGRESQVSFQLLDSHGNPIIDAQNDITTIIDKKTESTAIWDTDIDKGIYAAKISGQQSGTHTIQVVMGKTVSQEQKFNTRGTNAVASVAADGSGPLGTLGVIADIEIDINPNRTDFKSGDNPLVMVTLKDSFGNEIENIDPSNIHLGDLKGNDIAWRQDGKYDYIVNLPLTKTGDIDITAHVNGIFSPKTVLTVSHNVDISKIQDVVLPPINNTPQAGETPSISVVLTDSHGNPVNDVKQLEVIIAGTPHTLPATQNPDGSYTITLPAQHSGKQDIQVTVNGKDSNKETLTVQAPTPIPSKVQGNRGEQGVLETVTLSSAALTGLQSGDALDLTVTAKDAFKNPLTGLASAIALTHGQTGSITWTDNQDGTYTASLTLSKLGKDSLTATAHKVDSNTLKVNVTNRTGHTGVQNVAITPTNKAPQAGETPTLTVTLTDSNGNPVNDIQQLEVTIAGTTHTLPATQNPDGSYTVPLPAQHSGKQDIQVIINGKDSNKETLTVQAPTPIPSKVQGNMGEQGVLETVALSSAALTGLQSGDTLDLTVTAKDAFKNPLTGLASAIALTHGQTGSFVWKDHHDGTYTTSLPLTKLGSDSLTATINTIASQPISITVETQQTKTSVNAVELHAQHLQISAGQSTTLTLTLRDKHNNNVEKIPSSDIKLEDNKLTLSNIQWKEQGNGVYTTEISFKQLGNHKLVSTVGFTNSPSIDIDVIALKGAIHVHHVNLDATPKQFVVGEKIQLKLTLLDQFNNGVTDVLDNSININDDNTRSALKGLQWHHQQKGVYTAETTVTKGGIHSLKATVNSKQDNVLIHAISSVGQKQVSDVQLSTSTANIVAGTPATLILKLNDQHSNPVSQVNSADISLENSAGTPLPTTWLEMNNLGIYTAQISLNSVVKQTVTVKVNNISHNATLQVTPPQGASSVATLEISPITTVDAGHTSSITLIMKDKYGNPVNNVLNRDMTLEIDGVIQSIQLTELGDTGQYSGELPAQQKGQHAVKVTVNGQLASVNWTINNPMPIPLSTVDRTGQRGALDTVMLSSSKKTVGSGDKITVTLNLMDKFNNPLTGANSHLKLLTNLSEISQWQDHSDGSYSIDLLMNRLGSQDVQAIVKNILSNKVTLEIKALSGASNVNTTALTIKDAAIEAGDTTELTLRLKDSVDNGVTNIQNRDIHLTQNNAKIDKKWLSAMDGIYTTQVQIKQVGVYPLRATVNQQNSRIETIEVTAPVGSTKVAKAKLASSIVNLDAGSNVELTLELKDQYDNLIIGVNGSDIMLENSYTAETIDNSRLAWRMDSAGIYKASLPLTLVGKHKLSAVINKQRTSTADITVNALKGAANVSQVIITTGKNTISVGEKTELTLKVQDRFGNEVDDVLASDIDLTNTDSKIKTSVKWVKSPLTLGTYITDVQFDKVKSHTLIASVNGQTKMLQIHVQPLKGYSNVAAIALQAPAKIEVAEKTKLTLTLMDKFNNGVVGVEAQHIELLIGSTLQTTTWVDNQDGSYHTEFALNQAGDTPLMVTVNKFTETNSIHVNSPSGKDKVASIQLAATVTQVLPNTSTVLTLTLKDQYGNGVNNVRSKDILLSNSYTPENLTSPNWAEDGKQSGIYTASVNLQKVAEHTLTAKVNNLDNILKITVQPFTEIQHVNSLELAIDNNNITLGENVMFTLSTKDIYGNNVMIKPADIHLNNANGAVNQPTWKEQNGEYKGEMILSISGNYVITANVGTQISAPINLTVQAGTPVFATGKSQLSVNRDDLDENSSTNAIVTLELKDANGVAIKGKKPHIQATAGKIDRIMIETTDGVYTANFNNPVVGESTIYLDKASIDYSGSTPEIIVVTYGKLKIKALGREHIFSENDEFPHTGFAGAQFQIIAPIGKQTDYDWSVDIDWLSIDKEGIVTLLRKPTPIKGINAMIPIFTGKPKAHTNYKRTVAYRFTLKKWYEYKGDFSVQKAINVCQAPSRVILRDDLVTSGATWVMQRKAGERVFHEWDNQHFLKQLVPNTQPILLLADMQTSTKLTHALNPYNYELMKANDERGVICVDDLQP